MYVDGFLQSCALVIVFYGNLFFVEQFSRLNTAIVISRHAKSLAYNTAKHF